MKPITIRRWTVRALRAAGLTGALALGAAALAQSSVPGPGRVLATKKTFTKNTTFNLPIQMDERTRASLKEVRLYVKSGAGDWAMQEAVSPQTPHFTYRVPQDGEYCFSLVTVDRAGRQTPADVNLEPPALRVVVDTRAPVVEATVVPEFGEHLLRINVIDANADTGTVRVAVMSEAGERPLAPAPGQPGTYRLSAGDLNVPVRITASDLCGNATYRELVARDLMPAAPPLVRNEVPPSSLPPIPGTLPASPAIVTPPPAAPIITSNPLPLTPAPINPIPTAPTAPTAPPPLAAVAPTVPPPIAAVAPSVPPPPTGVVNSAAYRPNHDALEKPSQRKLLSTPKAQVEYRIDTVGPSGIGRVDIYLTTDRGQNWAKFGEDSDKRSPAEMDLPGDGVYGVRLAIMNGNGFGGRAPKAGDRPQVFFEVDATPPVVQLQPYEMVPGAGAIDIRWTASDANLGAEPVNIYYRNRTDSGWQPVARNIKNDGLCRWVLPRDIGPQVSLKVEVVDLAGNLTKVETPTPILLDQTEPEANVLDVVGVGGANPAQRAAPAIPNMIPPSVPNGGPR